MSKEMIKNERSDKYGKEKKNEAQDEQSFTKGADDNPSGMFPLGLSADDKKYLVQFEQQLQIARDFTRSVVDGRTTGFYLYGKGGCSKSYTVLQELDRLKVPFKLFNSHMLGRGLYDRLEESPTSIHVLEDMEPLFRNAGAMGVLRSALWCQPVKNSNGPLARPVTWTTCKMEHHFIFTGGIIMTTNRPFSDREELDAIKTRIGYMQLIVSDNELMAMMRYVSLNGYRRGSEIMEPAECMEVCEFIIDTCRGLGRAMDMRMLINGYQDYLQWSENESGCHWRDLVGTRIKERPIGVNGQVVLRPMMYTALTYDHRIVDGAEAVQFLVRVKELVEDPGVLLIES